MNKRVRLKVCNRALLAVAVAMLISGVQLEAIHSDGVVSVWVHVVVGLLFMVLAAYHVFLHFGESNWFVRFRRQRSQVSRILWWVSLATLVTGVIALARWTVTLTHWHIGGVHGKLGLLMMLLSAAHIVRRAKFFKR